MDTVALGGFTGSANYFGVPLEAQVAGSHEVQILAAVDLSDRAGRTFEQGHGEQEGLRTRDSGLGTRD